VITEHGACGAMVRHEKGPLTGAISRPPRERVKASDLCVSDFCRPFRAKGARTAEA